MKLLKEEILFLLVIFLMLQNIISIFSESNSGWSGDDSEGGMGENIQEICHKFSKLSFLSSRYKLNMSFFDFRLSL